jgi:hypothetical protein
MLNIPHRVPVPGTGGITHRDDTGRTDERSSHAVETFFLTGDPMNYNIPIIPGKNTSKSGRNSSTKKGIIGDTLLITHTGIFPSFFTKTSVLTVTCSPENSISLIPVSLITIIWGVNGVP